MTKASHTRFRTRKVVNSPSSSQCIRSPRLGSKKNVASEQDKTDGAQHRPRVGTGRHHFALYLEPCELRRDARFWAVCKKKYDDLSRKEKQHWVEVARIKGISTSNAHKVQPSVKLGDQAKNVACSAFAKAGAQKEPDENVMESPVQPGRRSLGNFGSFFSTDLSQNSVAPSQPRKRPPFAHPMPTSTSDDLLEPLRRAGALEIHGAPSREPMSHNTRTPSSDTEKTAHARETRDTSPFAPRECHAQHGNTDVDKENAFAAIGTKYRVCETRETSPFATRVRHARNGHIYGNKENTPSRVERTHHACEKHGMSPFKTRLGDARNRNIGVDRENGSAARSKEYDVFDEREMSSLKTRVCKALNKNISSSKRNLSSEMDPTRMGAKMNRHERCGTLMQETDAADVSDAHVASRKSECFTPQIIRPSTKATDTTDSKGQNTAARGGTKRKAEGNTEFDNFGGMKKVKRGAKAMLARENRLRNLIAHTTTKDARVQRDDGAHVGTTIGDDHGGHADSEHIHTPMDKKRESSSQTQVRTKRSVKAMQVREEVLRGLIGKTTNAQSSCGQSMGQTPRTAEADVIGSEAPGEQMLEGSDVSSRGGAASETTSCETKKQPLTDEEMIAYAAKTSSFLIYMNVAHDLRRPTVKDVNDWRNLSLVDQAVLAAIYNHRNFLEEVGFLHKAFGEFPRWYINNTLLWNPFAHFLRDHVGNVTTAQEILQAEKDLFNSPLELKRKYVCTNL